MKINRQIIFTFNEEYFILMVIERTKFTFIFLTDRITIQNTRRLNLLLDSFS